MPVASSSHTNFCCPSLEMNQDRRLLSPQGGWLCPHAWPPHSLGQGSGHSMLGTAFTPRVPTGSHRLRLQASPAAALLCGPRLCHLCLCSRNTGWFGCPGASPGLLCHLPTVSPGPSTLPLLQESIQWQWTQGGGQHGTCPLA